MRDYQADMRFSLALLIAVGVGLAAQPTPLVLGPVGYGYTLPTPIYAAPGQLLTLIVYVEDNPGFRTVRAPAGADLPTTLTGVSVIYWQRFTFPPVPILEVRTFFACPNPLGAPFVCTALAAITVQIPLEAQSCPQCPPYGIAAGSLTVDRDGAPGFQIDVQPLADQAHILTNCDNFILDGPAFQAPLNPTGLPCPSIVTHADGAPVSATNPAQGGEELVAYAVGLGQTTPPLMTGKLVTAAAPTQTTFTLDFNYRPNALATKPLPGAPQPLYAGATPGFVGLYQINFVVPPVPAGTPPCVEPPTVPQPGLNVVQSNLTVSIGGQFSFDAARICVAVPSP